MQPAAAKLHRVPQINSLALRQIESALGLVLGVQRIPSVDCHSMYSSQGSASNSAFVAALRILQLSPDGECVEPCAVNARFMSNPRSKHENVSKTRELIQDRKLSASCAFIAPLREQPRSWSATGHFVAEQQSKSTRAGAQPNQNRNHSTRLDRSCDVQVTPSSS